MHASQGEIGHMPEQALYLKWRPQSFDDFVGQEHIRRTLLNAMRTGRVRHAYLFSGPRGTGKTTTARLLAKAVNCLHPEIEARPCNQCAPCVAVNEGRFLDLIEIDAATHTGVDDVRDLRDRIAFAPGEGRYKVYIIDEVHRFSGSAFDALLKTLEEPPEHALFVLATTEIDKVPQTIKSRCLQFEFRRFSIEEVADRLAVIVEAEGMRYERAALDMIARQGTGSMRDSISLLDQIVTDPEEPITAELVEGVLGTASSAAVRALVEALAADDIGQGLRVINRAVDTGTDPRQFGQQITEYLRNVIIAQTAGAALIEASGEERAAYTAYAAGIPAGRLVKALRAFNDSVNQFRGGWQPQLALELAWMETLSAPVPSVSETAAPAQPEAPARPARPPQPPPPEADDLPAAEPGTVTLALVNEAWPRVLGMIAQRSSTSQAVMQYFRPLRVEGDVIVLGTTNTLYFNRIAPYPEKKKVIEEAVSRVFRKRLRVQLQMIGENGDESSTGGAVPQAADSLLSTGLEFGARITPIDE
jgi:DNA polymerase-3 subunit gamma/tau